MLQRSLTAPWQHTYRNLLREATYLPDPIARRHMLGHIRERYRVYWPYFLNANNDEGPGKGRNGLYDRDTRNVPQQPPALTITFSTLQLSTVERRARKLLSLLRRANEGYIKALTRVLMLSYGRTGERRYELLEPLVVGHHRDTPSKAEITIGPSREERERYKNRYYPSVPDMPTIPSPRMRLLKPGPPSQCPVPFTPSEKLLALIASQSANMYVRAANVRPTIHAGELMPVQEKSTRWGKKVDERKLMEIWYRKIITKVLPPLPVDELQTLVQLCQGKGKLNLPIRRRQSTITNQASLSSSSTAEENDESTFEGHSLTPDFLTFGPAKGETFEKHTRGRPHRVTRSLLSKIWLEVLNLVPQLSSERAEDSGKEVWKIEWGLEPSLNHKPLAAANAPAVDDYNEDDNISMLPSKDTMDVLFGGVDALTGQKPNLKRELRRRHKLMEASANQADMENIPSAAVEGLDLRRPKHTDNRKPLHPEKENTT